MLKVMQATFEKRLHLENDELRPGEAGYKDQLNRVAAEVAAEHGRPWFSANELARWLGVSYPTIQSWRRRQKGPKWRLQGCKLCYAIRDVLEWEDIQELRAATGRMRKVTKRRTTKEHRQALMQAKLARLALSGMTTFSQAAETLRARQLMFGPPRREGVLE